MLILLSSSSHLKLSSFSIQLPALRRLSLWFLLQDSSIQLFSSFVIFKPPPPPNAKISFQQKQTSADYEKSVLGYFESSLVEATRSSLGSKMVFLPLSFIFFRPYRFSTFFGSFMFSRIGFWMCPLFSFYCFRG